jgi:ABC-type Fe3+ transport system permease subunit
MKKLLTTTLLSLVAVFGLAAVPQVALAQSPADQIQGGVNEVDPEGGEGPELQDQIRIVVNILLFLLGAVAVVMIVIGGIRFSTANGDQSAVTSARNTILYAVVGLVVAIMAYAIVNFVLDQFTT